MSADDEMSEEQPECMLMRRLDAAGRFMEESTACRQTSTNVRDTLIVATVEIVVAGLLI